MCEGIEVTWRKEESEDFDQGRVSFLFLFIKKKPDDSVPRRNLCNFLT